MRTAETLFHNSILYYNTPFLRKCQVGDIKLFFHHTKQAPDDKTVGNLQYSSTGAATLISNREASQVFWKEREGYGEGEDNLLFTKGFLFFPVAAALRLLSRAAATSLMPAGRSQGVCRCSRRPRSRLCRGRKRIRGRSYFRQYGGRFRRKRAPFCRWCDRTLYGDL